MKSLFTAQQLRDTDAYCERQLNLPTLTLMARAALCLAKECAATLPPTGQVLFLCGTGNNAGDGFAAARVLKEMGYAVTVALLLGREFSPDAAVMFRSVSPAMIVESEEDIFAASQTADLVVDCLFGTGFRGDLPGAVRATFDSVRHKPIIACDLPSGVGCDDGSVCVGSLRAQKTVTFGALKPCFFLYPAKDRCGSVIVADIGIPAQALQQQSPGMALPEEEDIRQLLLPRHENAHKGSFGTLLLVCGSKLMPGAACLAALGALRSGVGLVQLAVPKSIRPVLQSRLCEPIYCERRGILRTSAVLVGCGIGDDPKAVRFALSHKKPIVLDADALNCIAKAPHILEDFLQENPGIEVVLTPHPAEFARLTGKSVALIESDRITAAREYAKQYPVTLVLKGHHTLIAAGNQLYLNQSGNTGLAKGGSGDVLAGIIASLLAQGHTARDAALCGVYLHGTAADRLAQKSSQRGMLPSDIPEEVACLLGRFEAQ